MAIRSHRKRYHISLRLPETDLALIDRAALLRGHSRADFVREAAVKAAEGALFEQRLFQMSQEGFAEFLVALAHPAEAVPELVEVLRHPTPWKAGYEERH